MASSTDIWHIITSLGDFQTWLVIVSTILLVYIILPKSKKNRVAWLVFILLPSIFISSAITELIKISTQVPRPCIGADDCPSGYSFPSRHASTMFVLATVAALNIKDFGVRSALFAVAVLVSLSRVALNYHTYVDIIAGALLGIFIAYLVNMAYKRKI